MAGVIPLALTRTNPISGGILPEHYTPEFKKALAEMTPAKLREHLNGIASPAEIDAALVRLEVVRADVAAKETVAAMADPELKTFVESHASAGDLLAKLGAPAVKAMLKKQSLFEAVAGDGFFKWAGEHPEAAKKMFELHNKRDANLADIAKQHGVETAEHVAELFTEFPPEVVRAHLLSASHLEALGSADGLRAAQEALRQSAADIVRVLPDGTVLSRGPVAPASLAAEMEARSYLGNDKYDALVKEGVSTPELGQGKAGWEQWQQARATLQGKPLTLDNCIEAYGQMMGAASQAKLRATGPNESIGFGTGGADLHHPLTAAQYEAVRHNPDLELEVLPRYANDAPDVAQRVRINFKNHDAAGNELKARVNEALSRAEANLMVEDPIEVVAQLERDLVSVQPFADGNHRFARLAAAALLERAGYPPVSLDRESPLFMTPAEVATALRRCFANDAARQESSLFASLRDGTATLSPNEVAGKLHRIWEHVGETKGRLELAWSHASEGLFRARAIAATARIAPESRAAAEQALVEVSLRNVETLAKPNADTGPIRVEMLAALAKAGIPNDIALATIRDWQLNTKLERFVPPTDVERQQTAATIAAANAPAKVAIDLKTSVDALSDPAFAKRLAQHLWENGAGTGKGKIGKDGAIDRTAILALVMREAKAAGLYAPSDSERPQSRSKFLSDEEFQKSLAEGRLQFDLVMEGLAHGSDTHLLQVAALLLRNRELVAEGKAPIDIKGMLQFIGTVGQSEGGSKTAVRLWDLIFDNESGSTLSAPEYFNTLIEAMQPFGAAAQARVDRQEARAGNLARRTLPSDAVPRARIELAAMNALAPMDPRPHAQAAAADAAAKRGILERYGASAQKLDELVPASTHETDEAQTKREITAKLPFDPAPTTEEQALLERARTRFGNDDYARAWLHEYRDEKLGIEQRNHDAFEPVETSDKLEALKNTLDVPSEVARQAFDILSIKPNAAQEMAPILARCREQLAAAPAAKTPPDARAVAAQQQFVQQFSAGGLIAERLKQSGILAPGVNGPSPAVTAALRSVFEGEHASVDRTGAANVDHLASVFAGTLAQARALKGAPLGQAEVDQLALQTVLTDATGKGRTPEELKNMPTAPLKDRDGNPIPNNGGAFWAYAVANDPSLASKPFLASVLLHGIVDFATIDKAVKAAGGSKQDAQKAYEAVLGHHMAGFVADGMAKTGVTLDFAKMIKDGQIRPETGARLERLYDKSIALAAKWRPIIDKTIAEARPMTAEQHAEYAKDAEGLRQVVGELREHDSHVYLQLTSDDAQQFTAVGMPKWFEMMAARPPPKASNRELQTSVYSDAVTAYLWENNARGTASDFIAASQAIADRQGIHFNPDTLTYAPAQPTDREYATFAARIATDPELASQFIEHTQAKLTAKELSAKVADDPKLAKTIVEWMRERPANSAELSRLAADRPGENSVATAPPASAAALDLPRAVRQPFDDRIGSMPPKDAATFANLLAKARDKSPVHAELLARMLAYGYPIEQIEVAAKKSIGLDGEKGLSSDALVKVPDFRQELDSACQKACLDYARASYDLAIHSLLAEGDEIFGRQADALQQRNATSTGFDPIFDHEIQNDLLSTYGVNYEKIPATDGISATSLDAVDATLAGKKPVFLYTQADGQPPHMVVIVKAEGNGYRIFDPASGEHVVSQSDLWNGKVGDAKLLFLVQPERVEAPLARQIDPPSPGEKDFHSRVRIGAFDEPLGNSPKADWVLERQRMATAVAKEPSATTEEHGAALTELKTLNAIAHTSDGQSAEFAAAIIGNLHQRKWESRAEFGKRKQEVLETLNGLMPRGEIKDPQTVKNARQAVKTLLDGVRFDSDDTPAAPPQLLARLARSGEPISPVDLRDGAYYLKIGAGFAPEELARVTDPKASDRDVAIAFRALVAKGRITAPVANGPTLVRGIEQQVSNEHGTFGINSLIEMPYGGVGRIVEFSTDKHGIVQARFEPLSWVIERTLALEPMPSAELRPPKTEAERKALPPPPPLPRAPELPKLSLVGLAPERPSTSIFHLDSADGRRIQQHDNVVIPGQRPGETWFLGGADPARGTATAYRMVKGAVAENRSISLDALEVLNPVRRNSPVRFFDGQTPLSGRVTDYEETDHGRLAIVKMDGGGERKVPVGILIPQRFPFAPSDVAMLNGRPVSVERIFNPQHVQVRTEAGQSVVVSVDQLVAERPLYRGREVLLTDARWPGQAARGEIVRVGQDGVDVVVRGADGKEQMLRYDASDFAMVGSQLRGHLGVAPSFDTAQRYLQSQDAQRFVDFYDHGTTAQKHFLSVVAEVLPKNPDLARQALALYAQAGGDPRLLVKLRSALLGGGDPPRDLFVLGKLYAERAKNVASYNQSTSPELKDAAYVEVAIIDAGLNQLLAEPTTSSGRTLFDNLSRAGNDATVYELLRQADPPRPRVQAVAPAEVAPAAPTVMSAEARHAGDWLLANSAAMGLKQRVELLLARGGAGGEELMLLADLVQKSGSADTLQAQRADLALKSLANNPPTTNHDAVLRGLVRAREMNAASPGSGDRLYWEVVGMAATSFEHNAGLTGGHAVDIGVEYRFANDGLPDESTWPTHAVTIQGQVRPARVIGTFPDGSVQVLVSGEKTPVRLSAKVVEPLNPENQKLFPVAAESRVDAARPSQGYLLGGTKSFDLVWDVTQQRFRMVKARITSGGDRTSEFEATAHGKQAVGLLGSELEHKVLAARADIDKIVAQLPTDQQQALRREFDASWPKDTVFNELPAGKQMALWKEFLQNKVDRMVHQARSPAEVAFNMTAFAERGSFADVEQAQILMRAYFGDKLPSSEALMRLATADGLQQFPDMGCGPANVQIVGAAASLLEALRMVAIGPKAVAKEQADMMNQIGAAVRMRNDRRALPGLGVLHQTLSLTLANLEGGGTQEGSYPIQAQYWMNKHIGPRLGTSYSYERPSTRDAAGVPTERAMSDFKQHLWQQFDGARPLPSEGVFVSIEWVDPATGATNSGHWVQVKSGYEKRGPSGAPEHFYVVRDPWTGKSSEIPESVLFNAKGGPVLNGNGRVGTMLFREPPAVTMLRNQFPGDWISGDAYSHAYSLAQALETNPATHAEGLQARAKLEAVLNTSLSKEQKLETIADIEAGLEHRSIPGSQIPEVPSTGQKEQNKLAYDSKRNEALQNDPHYKAAIATSDGQKVAGTIAEHLALPLLQKRYAEQHPNMSILTGVKFLRPERDVRTLEDARYKFPERFRDGGNGGFYPVNGKIYREVGEADALICDKSAMGSPIPFAIAETKGATRTATRQSALGQASKVEGYILNRPSDMVTFLTGPDGELGARVTLAQPVQTAQRTRTIEKVTVGPAGSDFDVKLPYTADDIRRTASALIEASRNTNQGPKLGGPAPKGPTPEEIAERKTDFTEELRSHHGLNVKKPEGGFRPAKPEDVFEPDALALFMRLSTEKLSVAYDEKFVEAFRQGGQKLTEGKVRELAGLTPPPPKEPVAKAPHIDVAAPPTDSVAQRRPIIVSQAPGLDGIADSYANRPLDLINDQLDGKIPKHKGEDGKPLSDLKYIASDSPQIKAACSRFGITLPANDESGRSKIGIAGAMVMEKKHPQLAQAFAQTVTSEIKAGKDPEPLFKRAQLLIDLSASDVNVKTLLQDPDAARAALTGSIDTPEALSQFLAATKGRWSPAHALAVGNLALLEAEPRIGTDLMKKNVVTREDLTSEHGKKVGAIGLFVERANAINTSGRDAIQAARDHRGVTSEKQLQDLAAQVRAINTFASEHQLAAFLPEFPKTTDFDQWVKHALH